MTSTRLGHRPELDGLRGIAVLVVLASHARVPFAGDGAPAGVILFFALSGYLITGILVGERERTGRIDLPAFYMRRALRLLPALYLVILVVLAGYAAGLWPREPLAPGALVGILAYVGNWTTVAGQSAGVLPHTWSLAVEEQFYLLWPAVLIVALRFGSRRTAGLVLVALAALVTPWRFVLMLSAGYDRVYFGTDCVADALLFGCAVALLRVRLPAWAGVAGVAALIAVAQAWPPVPLADPLAVVASTVAVAGAPAMLAQRPLMYLGRISYGLYLWQGILLFWGLPWFVVVAASVGLASLSFRFVEQPFLRQKRRFERSQMGSPSVQSKGAGSGGGGEAVTVTV